MPRCFLWLPLMSGEFEPEVTEIITDDDLDPQLDSEMAYLTGKRRGLELRLSGLFPI